jgi:signal transduction histidine kinase
MKVSSSKQKNDFKRNPKKSQDFRDLSLQILQLATSGLPRIDFIREVSKMLIEFSGCDSVEIRLNERTKYYYCKTIDINAKTFQYEIKSCAQNPGEIIPGFENNIYLKKLLNIIFQKRHKASSSFFTSLGSFYTNDTTKSIRIDKLSQIQNYYINLSNIEQKSLVLIPISINNEYIGILQFGSNSPNYFHKNEIESYEGVVDIFGFALTHRRAQVALRERVKELTCLYGITRLVVHPDISLENILQGIVDLLPPAWLYPEISVSKIILDSNCFTSPGYRDNKYKISAGIIIKQKKRGTVEVIYLEEKPEIYEGPFLKEERNLIDAVAREIALIVERREVEEEKSKLQEQLRHADRLATIGQLAAGVAHEINEPLGNILGFAQLAIKCSDLPEQARQDVEKIINASLHAREIIKKLLIFARQMPTLKTPVNLNEIIHESFNLLESRFTTEGIKIEYSLSEDLPEITADPGQLHQVFVNLFVNALHAMPRGGILKIKTIKKDDIIHLRIEDTGIGMSEEIQKQIFLPFFTTKEVGQGTGLGLSVVHGIVTSHGGSIKVESKLGKGTSFEILLPISKLSNSMEKMDNAQLK